LIAADLWRELKARGCSARTLPCPARA